MSLIYTPRPHQEVMARHLARVIPSIERGAALHAGCGTGKTVVTATHIVESLFDRMNTRKWLIVAPKPVAEDTWWREFEKWEHLSFVRPRLLTFADLGLKVGQKPDRKTYLEFGQRKETKRDLIACPAPVHVAAYELVPWLVRGTGVNFPYDGVVLDESVFARDPGSLRHRALWHALSRGYVKELIELCGTPLPKGYEDLYGQFRLMDKGERLGHSLTEFRQRWMEPDTVGRMGQVFSWRLRPEEMTGIQARIAELAVSVDHDLGIPVVESLQHVQLPVKAMAAYREMEADMMLKLGDTDILAANAAVVASKLVQLANGHVFDNAGKSHRTHTAKLEAIQAAVEASPGPVMVGYLFQEDREGLQRVLGRSVALAGDPGALDAFRGGKAKVLLFHPETVAYGVDGLQGICDTLFWCGMPYRYDWWHQAFKRLQREGQKSKTVFVRAFVAEGTREEAIYRQVILPRGRQNDGLLRAIKGE